MLHLFDFSEELVLMLVIQGVGMGDIDEGFLCLQSRKHYLVLRLQDTALLAQGGGGPGVVTPASWIRKRQWCSRSEVIPKECVTVFGTLFNMLQ